MAIESQSRTDDATPSRGPVRRSRRRLAVLAGGLALTLAVISLVWLEGVPRYRPGLGPGEQHGLDVSAHQGRIDWPAVAGDGISAVYMKASEGDDFVDRRFAENWSESGAAGLPRGAYHFFTLCSSGAAQAANFLRVVPVDPGALPPAVDLEFSGCSRRPDPKDFQRELSTFVAIVERAIGRSVMIYALPSFTRRYPLPDVLSRRRWVRSLFRRPEPGWAVWQVSDRARVDGIDGPVDLNVWSPGAAA